MDFSRIEWIRRGLSFPTLLIDLCLEIQPQVYEAKADESPNNNAEPSPFTGELP